MAGCQFARLRVLMTRLLITIVLLPCIGGVPLDSRQKSDLNNPLGSVPPGWTAVQWRSAYDFIRSDMVAPAFQAVTWEQKKHLTQSTDSVNWGDYGYAVDIDDDLLVIGCPGDSAKDTLAGSVYIFKKPLYGWSKVYPYGKIYAEDPGFRDYFGTSVAISGNRIVVGAPDDDTSTVASDHGSVYLFDLTFQHGWTQMAKLTTIQLDNLAMLGTSVDIDGDVIVAGAPGTKVGDNVNQGAAYVFQIPEGGWNGPPHEAGRLYQTDGRDYDQFGTSVAINGHTILVGADAHDLSLDDPALMTAGKVYVYYDDDNIWENREQTATFTASDAAAHDYFGWSVAIDGDLAVVGAPGEIGVDSTGRDAAYLFKRPEGGWSGSYHETAILLASDGKYSDQFGYVVGISGGTAIVGAPQADLWHGTDAGAVYVYTEPEGGWIDTATPVTQYQKLAPDYFRAGFEFGRSLAIDGTSIAVGAPKEREGQVYLFDSAPPPPWSWFQYWPVVQ